MRIAAVHCPLITAHCPLSLSTLRVFLIFSVTQQVPALMAARVNRADVFATAHLPDGRDLPVLLDRVVRDFFLRRLPRRSFLNVGGFGVRNFAHSIFAPELILRVSGEIVRHCATAMKRRQKTRCLTLTIPSTRIFHRLRNICLNMPVSIIEVVY